MTPLRIPALAGAMIALLAIATDSPRASRAADPAPPPSASAQPSVADPTVPLRAWLRHPDSSFAWSKVSERTLPNGVTLTELSLTSQTWHGITWKHHLVALKPKIMRKNPTALLYITGGYNPLESMVFSALVNEAKEPLFILFDIPNQPLFGDLHEDQLIAYTFNQYLETGDATWPLLFPMTKGAHRAMDAAQAFGKQAWKTSIGGFVVTGASKRGWTTYLTGATDPRVKGIAPMVYNNLNLGPQMKHQKDQWGQYSEQIEDYTKLGLQEKLQTERGQALSAMVDPYSFRRDLRMPKLLIHGTNDRYWTLDATRFYYNDLIGRRNLLNVPNSGHGLQDHTRVLNSLGAFWDAVSRGKTLPQVIATSRQSDDEGLVITLRAEGAPKALRVWRATNPTSDFRESQWTSTSASIGVKGETVVKTPLPKQGFEAVFVELAYPGPLGDYTVSTPIEIIRDRTITQ